MPCFKSWRELLEREGYIVDIQIVPSDKENIGTYRQALIKKLYAGSIFIGHLKLPKIVIQDFNDRKNEAITSALELMNTGYGFPEKGITTWFGIPFYSGMNKWTGVISDGGATNGTPKDRILNYCQYFDRNVAYRSCTVLDNRLKVVGFVDKNWDNEFSGQRDYKCLSDHCFVLKALTDLKKINLVLSPTQDFCHLSVHSDSQGHYPSIRTVDGKTEFGYFGVSDIKKANPNVRFYNLFSCSAGAPCEVPNVAETYLMNTSSALGVFASTKEGSINNPKQLYKSLLSGKTFGDSYLSYMKNQLDSYTTSAQKSELQWNSGLLFYGDPTLTLHPCDESSPIKANPVEHK